MARSSKRTLVHVHTRLFSEDVRTLQGLASERGTSLHAELRALVRRALRGEKRDFLVLKEGE